MRVTVTVELVNKDYLRDQHYVVLIHRWSLYAGLVTRKIYTWEPLKFGPYNRQVVFIYKCSFEQVSMYMCMCVTLSYKHSCSTATSKLRSTVLAAEAKVN